VVERGAEDMERDTAELAELDAAQARPTEIGEDKVQAPLRLGKELYRQPQPIAT
jgi:hypothetical protein